MIRREDGRDFFIFDCHVHLGDSSFVRRYFPGGTGFSGTWWVERMDELGMDKCLIFPVVNAHTNYRRDNDRMVEWAREYPDRLVPFMRLHPYFEEEAVADVARYAAEGAVGIKLHSRMDGGFALNDPVLIRPILREAEKHRLLILFHTGEMHFSMPGLLWDVALDYPHLRFICGHMGGWDGFQEALAMTKRVSNVWLDTTLIWPPNLVQHAVQAVGADRIVYGSDSPYIPVGAEVEKIMKWANISDEDSDLILGRNMERILAEREADASALKRDEPTRKEIALEPSTAQGRLATDELPLDP
jgi:predicted TIM-barrel fold metal-dependent hydrolase